jgi:hypothetical protein
MKKYWHWLANNAGLPRKTTLFQGESSSSSRDPLDLSAKLDALLLVDDSVMKYARHGSASTLG